MTRRSESAKESAAITEALAKVQKDALGGRTPTAELRALWAHALGAEGDAFFTDTDYGEARLVEGQAEGTEDYVGCAEGDAWAALFEEIAWVAQEAEGGLVGYYHRGSPSLDTAAIVHLDNEGSLRLTGPTLVDHFAATKGRGLTALKAFCDAARLPMPLDAKTRRARLTAAGDPAKRLEALLLTSRPRASTTGQGDAERPVARPVDRHPAAVRLDRWRYVVVSNEDDVAATVLDGSAAFLFDARDRRFRQVAPTPVRVTLHIRGIGCLPDGRAVFADVTEKPRVVVYDPDTDRWTAGDASDEPHEGAFVALLPDGKVLFAGGQRTYGYMTQVVSCYDIHDAKWSRVGELGVGRMDAFGALLASGALLLLGGTVRGKEYPEATTSCERFDPGTKQSVPMDPLPRAMEQVGGSVLADGRIVMADLDGACIYDPRGQPHATAIDDERASSTCVLLADGRVALFAGRRSGTDFDASRKVHILDPSTGAIAPAGETRLIGHRHTLPLPIDDGTVLLVGGDLFHNIAREPEIWDPIAGRGEPLPDFEKPFRKQERDQKKHVDKEATKYAQMMARARQERGAGMG